MLHALCHVESVAINLSWDILLRWCDLAHLDETFFATWAKVAADEAKHHLILKARLLEKHNVNYVME